MAQGLAIGSTLVSGAALAVGGHGGNDSLAAAGAIGLLVVPSLGHWYAGEVDGKGLGLRLGGAALGFGGLLMIASTINFDEKETVEDEDFRGGLGLGLLATGGLMFLGGVGYSWLTADDAVREHNARFTLLPVASSTMTGLTVAGTF